MGVFGSYRWVRECTFSLLNFIMIVHSSVSQEQSLCPNTGQNEKYLPVAKVSHRFDDLHPPIPSSSPGVPRFITTNTKSSITAIEGSNVLLHCEIANLGRSTIFWYKKDFGSQFREPLFSGKNTGHIITVRNRVINQWGSFHLNITENSYNLWFPNVSRSNAGTYICAFKTQTGEQQLNFTLNVSYKPEINEILPKMAPYWKPDQPTKVFVNETDNITLYCDVSAYPIPYTTWKRDRAIESGVCANKSLPLTGVTRSQSGGYKCTSENILGISISPTIQLVVQYAPRVRPEIEDLRGAAGKYLLLKCNIDAIPEAQIRWEKDGHIVSSLDLNYFAIISLDPETDYGTYRCIATNILGSASARINVTGLPVKPVVVSDPNGTRKHIYTLRWRTSEQRQDAITEQLPIDAYDISYRKVVIEITEGGLKRAVRYEPLEGMQEIYHLSKGWQEYHSFVLRDLSLNSSYELSLCPRNQYGRGECTNFAFKTSHEDRLTEPLPMNPGPSQIDYDVTIKSPGQLVQNAATTRSTSAVGYIIIFAVITTSLQYFITYPLVT